MSEQQNKLFVFERKEVVLIFLFIILIAVISFTLGVRTGKQLFLKSEGFTQQDRETIDSQSIELKSVTEENVESSVEEPGDDVGANESKIDQKAYELRIKEEVAKLAEQDIQVENVEPTTKPAEPDESVKSEKPKAAYEGQYTIQLAAYQSEATAQDFANPFQMKGYDVIINQVDIPGKGVWYRVSIGAFSSRQEALKYISGQNSLFQDREYTINKL